MYMYSHSVLRYIRVYMEIHMHMYMYTLYSVQRYVCTCSEVYVHVPPPTGDPHSASEHRPGFLSDDELKHLVVEVRTREF